MNGFNKTKFEGKKKMHIHNGGGRALDMFLPEGLKESYKASTVPTQWNRNTNGRRLDEYGENKRNRRPLRDNKEVNVMKRDKPFPERESQKFIIARPQTQDQSQMSPKITILKPPSSRAVDGVISSYSNKSPDSSEDLKPKPKLSDFKGGRPVINVLPPLKIAPRPAAKLAEADKSTGKITPVKVMTEPIHILTDDFNLTEKHKSLSAFLLEQVQFKVIGVMGLQDTGKSTIASILAGEKDKYIKKQSTFVVGGESDCAYTTSNLDIYITDERLIILDFPPSLSAGVMDASSTKDATQHSLNLTQNLMKKSLEFLALALKVCHSIVVVQDNISNCDQLLNLVKTASIFNNKSSRDQGMKNLPSLTVLQNKVHPNISGLEKSVMKNYISASMSSCTLPFNAECDVLFVPDFSYTEDEINAKDIKWAMWKTPKRSFCHIPYTEKMWFENVLREWERIHKSCLYYDFSKLFP